MVPNDLKSNTFFHIYPALRELFRTSDRLWHSVEGIMQCRVTPDAGTRIRDIKRLTDWPDLATVLQDKRLAVFEEGYFSELQEASELWTQLKVETYEEQSEELYNLLLAGSDLTIHLIFQMRERAFGKWGATFFQHIIDQIQPNEGRKLGEMDYFQFMRGFVGDLSEQELLDGIHALSPSPSCPTVDAGTYSLTLPDREPCQLGNTNYFRMIEVLVERLNRYVPFLDLAERMGLGEVGIDSLPATKCRLLALLRKAGYEDLAECIRSQPSHYGLFIPSAIEM